MWRNGQVNPLFYDYFSAQMSPFQFNQQSIKKADPQIQSWMTGVQAVG